MLFLKTVFVLLCKWMKCYNVSSFFYEIICFPWLLILVDSISNLHVNDYSCVNVNLCNVWISTDLSASENAFYLITELHPNQNV